MDNLDPVTRSVSDAPEQVQKPSKIPPKSMTLTDEWIAKWIATHPSPKNGHRVRDKEVPGLVLWIGKLDRNWTVRAHYEGKTKRHVIGRVDEYSVDEARALAKKVVASFRHTGRAVSGNEPTAVTLADVFERYQPALIKRRSSPTTIAGYADIFKRLLVPLHRRIITKITRDEAEQLSDDLTKSSGMYSANSAIVLARALWNYADDALELPNMPERNPFRSSKHAPLLHPVSTRADRALTPDGLPEWERQRKRLADENPIRAEMHLFFLLSGMREGTVVRMEWPHVAERKRELLVPKIKGGKTMMLPLSDPMLACLERAREAGEQYFPKEAARWVWPSDGNKSATGHVTETKEAKIVSAKVAAKLVKDGAWVEVKSDVEGKKKVTRLVRTGHALRATYRGFLELHAGSPVVRKILMSQGVGGDVGERSYVNRDALSEEARAAQGRTSAAIMEALGK